ASTSSIGTISATALHHYPGLNWVESICRVLTAQGFQVAPRTYRNWKTAAPSARTITDAHLTKELRATIGTAEGLYGRRKMTAHLRREGHMSRPAPSTA
ncbi:hypothetical protein LQL77_32575, partial [Rhodococcus cerastii]|nr:hypothetical protein [Rhodococcus cerastii]